MGFSSQKKEMRRGQYNCTRAARVARKFWTKMKFPFLSSVIAESMWRAVGWVSDEKAKRGDQNFVAGFQMEKHELVAITNGS